MPLLREEANLLTLPSLQRGVIEVLITRGARELLTHIPFKSFEGESYQFNRERELPTDTSARDPYGESIPGGVGSRKRLAVESGMLARNADTAKIDVIGKSNINPQRTNDIVMAAKKLAQDFVEQFVYGMGDGNNLKGIEFWMGEYGSDFDEQKIFADASGDGTGAKQALSLHLLNDLLTRWKGEKFDVIYTDRETYVEIMNLLDQAGGNVAGMFMKDNYGEPVFAYRGTRVHVLDTIGKAKRAATAVADGTGVEVSDLADPFFLGFSDIDLGREISVNGVAQGTITSIVNAREVTVSAGVAATGVGILPKTHAIYAVRFDEEDGVTSVYHVNRGVPANPGQYFGPIGGFDAVDMGLLENSPRYRTRLDWFGNFVQQSPFAVARLSHYSVTS